MIQLCRLDKKTKLPDADYVLEKTDKFYDILSLLTPKFEGKWLFLLLDPKLAFVQEMLNGKHIPDWVDINLYMSRKKIEKLALEFPALQPKEKKFKDEVNDVLAELNHVVDERAKKMLIEVFRGNINELRDTLNKLDLECTAPTITAKQVQGTVNYTKRIYASDVINAFLVNDTRRWKMYQTLVKELGMEISYFAMYKYVKSLLLDKEAYLENKDIKQFIVKRVDAPLICYVYVLFANSTNANQTYAILHAIENRNDNSLSRIQRAN